jgi:hypothetical protein
MLRANWVYFCWYMPVAWGGLWLALTAWSDAALAGQYPSLSIRCKPLVVLGATLFACLLAIATSYLVFPFPLGTFSLGLPCFGCYFVLLSCCAAAPADAHGGSGLRLVRLCLFWVLWIITLFLSTYLAHLTTLAAFPDLLCQAGFLLAPTLAKSAAQITTRGIISSSDQFFSGAPALDMWWLYSAVLYKAFILSGSGSGGAVTPMSLVRVQVLLFLFNRLKVCAVVNASFRKPDQVQPPCPSRTAPCCRDPVTVSALPIWSPHTARSLLHRSGVRC